MKFEDFEKFDGIAIIHNGISYSYADLLIKIEEFVNHPKIIRLAGKVVIINSDYSFDTIALLFALERLRAILVPMVETTISESNSKRIACEAQYEVFFNEGIVVTELSCNDVKSHQYLELIKSERSGLVIFSSGTSGVPKVMVHDFSKILNSFDVPFKQKSLRILLFLLFDHIGGLNTLLSCLSKGNTTVLPLERTPTYILKLIESVKVQVFPTTPSFLNMLTQSGDLGIYDLSSLKLVTYGTERMPEALLIRIAGVLPNVRLIQTFGTSESGIVKTISKNSKSTFFKINDPSVEFRIIDGELHLKSELLISGYKDLTSDRFSSDGWFLTGDLVEEEGDFIRVIGRKTKVINVGGLKVLPSEVENVINEVEGVLDSTVFSVRNSITGEVVQAELVIDKNYDSELIKSLVKRHCRQKLDSYKVPVKFLLKDHSNLNYRFKKK